MTQSKKSINRIQTLRLQIIADAYQLFAQEVKIIQNRLTQKAISLDSAKKFFKKAYLKYERVVKIYA